MSLNCNEINVILDELNLEGSFIQDIIQPGYDTLALYTYKNSTAKTVLICTAQKSCRINETRRKITKNDKPLRFMEFLKSRIKGSKIISCRQLGFERVIKMELTHGEDSFLMYIRLWSNAGNIILCSKDGTVLDSMFRRPGKDEITGGRYEEPDLSAQNLERASQFKIRDFEELREEYESSTASSRPSFDQLSFNEKVDLFYSEHADTLSREALLEKAEKWYNEHSSRLNAALLKLEEKQKSFSLAEQKKHQGDLILSNAASIVPGSNYLECIDYETGRTVQIKIDQKKSAHENAAVYYETYKKEQSGLTQLEQDIKLTRDKIERLEKEYQAIKNERNPVRIEQMLRRDTKPKQQEKKTHPGLDFTVDGWYILVGRDANENDELLRHHVRGSDMWFHTRDCPGGYVFVKYRAGKTIPLDIMLDAGNLAVYYSKARKNGKADLYYTQVKHLRRAKNGPKGLVLPTQEKNLTITLDKNRLSRLDALKQEQEGI
ncbi:NFACT family protein [Treponema sp.]|uniref:NFACT family protein n=1 Tax=Treponema sp. TaxID=166 RepID=UPI00298E25FF|nr:NFACT family protein [Treponema sp.]MCR5612934.1 NFACT family protein [Treponema sp.]